MQLGQIIGNSLLAFAAGRPEGVPLSDEFGLHEGRGSEEWAAHEVAEFGKRAKRFGLRPGTLSVHVERVFADGSVVFSVRDGGGRFVYQDSWRFDGFGRVRGNGRSFEIVTKLVFRPGGHVTRGMAVKSQRGKIISVVPLGAEVSEITLNDGLGHDEDGFQSVQLTLPDDDLRGREMCFRISDNAGTRATEHVWMRGIEEPGFECPLSLRYQEAK